MYFMDGLRKRLLYAVHMQEILHYGAWPSPIVKNTQFHICTFCTVNPSFIDMSVSLELKFQPSHKLWESISNEIKTCDCR